MEKFEVSPDQVFKILHSQNEIESTQKTIKMTDTDIKEEEDKE